MKIFLFFYLVNSRIIDQLPSFDYNGKKYFYVNDPLTWTDAVKGCQNLGGNLVTIETQRENEEIGNFLCNVFGSFNNWQQGIWIGKSLLI